MLKRTAFAALIPWLLIASSGSAEQWAVDMFKKTSHDFGAVARGAKAEFAFTFENIYLEDARIQSVSSSCGCTSSKYPTEVVKTYQKGQIVASIDTRSFMGTKDATLTVTFDKPFAAEVTLHVHCYIRSDVVFQPGAIQFGSVRQGQVAQQKTTVSYAGRDDWAITDVKCPNAFLQAKLVEVGRNLGRVTYDLLVDLKRDAPAGYLGGQIVLLTNDADPRKREVPLAVEGIVVAALSVRPASLAFLSPGDGKPLQRNLVVQGYKPFRIIEASCPDKRIECVLPTEEKQFHILRVTFNPGPSQGKTETAIRIRTDQADSPEISVSVQADVAAPKPAAPEATPKPAAPEAAAGS
ncbi:MAG: DUF1573 domain-containing protein [Planctomycetia bacterium]|nr:DUF1573 domain-containing protein [Planctomycetia bacterium]